MENVIEIALTWFSKSLLSCFFFIKKIICCIQLMNKTLHLNTSKYTRFSVVCHPHSPCYQHQRCRSYIETVRIPSYVCRLVPQLFGMFRKDEKRLLRKVQAMAHLSLPCNLPHNFYCIPFVIDLINEGWIWSP